MEQFGKYQMLRRVGIGGMAEVYLARTTVAHGLSKQLVIKKIHPAYARSSQFMSMFIEEAKIALSLNHPNIVQVFDFGQVGQTFFLAMEYIEGVDVLRVLKDSQKQGIEIPLDIAAYIVQEAAKGLDYAHRKQDDFSVSLNIVHRDISPQNLLVSWDGAVKIVDFGIAKAKDTKEEEGIIKGKFAYMPPEQARGENVDRRADIFSAGVVLFELVCGSPLYKAKGKEALEQARAGALPSPRALNPKIPPELEETILRALSFDRKHRFQTARDFQHALGAFQFKWAQTHGRIPIDSGSLAQWMSRNLKRDILPIAPIVTPSITPEGISDDVETLPPSPLDSVQEAKESRERKPVFVLQGIVAGMDQLQAKIGLERAASLVQSFYKIARDIAFKHDATAVEPKDNAVRVVVGVPVAGEDDANRVMALALALIEALDGIGHDVEPDLRLAVGIERGTATVTRDEEGHYSHRLEDQAASAATALAREAQGAEIFVTSEVYRVSQNEWNFEALGATDVGASRIYRLRGIKERSQRLRERSANVDMIGRDLELKSLRDAYRECLVHGAHKIIVVAAESGMGKRTLINALLETIPNGEASVIRAAARPAMQHTPYGIIADFGRDAMGLAEGATPVEIRKRIAMLMDLLLPKENPKESVDLVDAACILMGVRNKNAASLDPDLLRARLRRISLSLESRFAPSKPLIVIAENVHWADEESLTLTRELIASSSTRGTLVLITSRPESRIIRLAHEEKADLIRLADLTPPHRKELIERRLAPKQDSKSLIRQILSRTGGNPFFINEVIDSLQDQGILVKDTGSPEPDLLRWSHRNRPIQIPTTVEALLATRIDRLPDQLKRLLVHASVLGMRFQTEELRALYPSVNMVDLNALVQRGLLRRGRHDHSFPNDMTMTVTYRMVPSEDRHQLHLLAAEKLASSLGYVAGRDDAKVARHLELAGENEKAANRYLKAASYAIVVGSMGDAFFQLGRSLKLWSPDRHEQRFLAHLKREEVLNRQVKRVMQETELKHLIEEAEILQQPAKLALAYTRKTDFHIECGQLQQAKLSGNAALRFAQDAHDALAEAAALRLKASTYRLLGQYDEALSTCEKALALIDDNPKALYERGMILNNLGTTLWNMNQLNEAIESYAETLVIFKNLRQPRRESGALNNMGIVFCALGEFEAALSHFKSSLGIDQRLGDNAQVATKLGNIGQTYIELGEFKKSEKYLLKALSVSEAHQDWGTILDVLNSLGQMYLAIRALKKAKGYLDRALELAIENHSHYQEIRALVSLAQVEIWVQGDYQKAHDLCHKAAQMARQLPMPVGEMQALSCQAMACLKLGRLDEALALSHQAVGTLETIEQSEGLEIILHAHALVCEQCGLESEAKEALKRCRAELDRKVDRLHAPGLKANYLASPAIASILSDSKRLLGR